MAQNICRALIKRGHDVHMFSTNGLDLFPEDLRPNLRVLDGEYDMQLTYTAMRNFSQYLSHGKKNRFPIWNYETTVLPQGFAKHYKYSDKMLPSSNFSKEIFANAGIPKEAMVVVPHGIDPSKFESAGAYPLKTKKSFKLLANIAQPHLRKNIPGLLEAFGKAFTKKDDVCLVLKVVDKPPSQVFEVSFAEIFGDFKRKYKDHAEIEVLSNFIVDIEGLYKSCHAIITMTHAECFWLPGLEAMAAGNLVIAPNYGGQLDYMNRDNSLLIDGKVGRADQRMQYWTQSPYAAVFNPDVDSAVDMLRFSFNNYENLMKDFRPNMKKVAEAFTWDNAAAQILRLAT